MASISDLRQHFLERGIELVASPTSDAFGSFLSKHAEEFAVLARDTGMKID